MVLEKTLENPLGSKEIQPVHSEGDRPWDIFGRNDAEAETPVLWPPDASLELVKDWETWHAAVHGVAKSQTRQSD